MVAQQRGQEMELHIGTVEPRAGTREAAGFGRVAGQHAAALLAEFEGLAQQAGEGAETHAHGRCRTVACREGDIEVVLQITTDTRQIDHGGDAHGL